MLVGVISDTHDNLTMVDAALAFFRERKVAALIHPGDFVAPFTMNRFVKFGAPLYATYGNNDGEREGLKRLHPELQDGPLFVELDGKMILIHHFIGWCDKKDVDRADIVITGHSHEIVNKVENGRLFLNPGECCGWVKERHTVALLDTASKTAEIIELQKPC